MKQIDQESQRELMCLKFASHSYAMVPTMVCRKHFDTNMR